MIKTKYPKKIKQHTVPKCYLENFTNHKGQNWIFNLESRNIYPSNPKDVLTDKHFYTIKFPTGGGTLVVENTLAAIEGAFVNVYRNRIEPREPLSPNERAIVSAFIGAMLFRTRSNRLAISNFINEVVTMSDHLNKMTPEEKKRAAALSIPSNNPSIPAGEFVEISKDIGSFHSKLLINLLPELSNIVFQMRWCFFYPKNKDLKFFTSDNPCALLNPVSINQFGYGAIGSSPGLGQKDVELIFPLSSSCCLLAGWILNQEIFFDADPKFIKSMNQKIMMCTHETLIGSDKIQLEEASKCFPNELNYYRLKAVVV